MIGGMTTETRHSWTCGSCTVTSRNPRLGTIPMPDSWDRDDEGKPRCAACRRETSGAGHSAGTKARKLEVARQMDEIREGLREHPDPGSNEALEEIADVIGCSVQKVRVARTQLSKKGEVAAQGQSAPARLYTGPMARRIEEALRRDHKRTNGEVAQEADATEQMVANVRSSLGGLKWDRNEEARAAAEDALRRLGETTAAAVADDLGIELETARQRLTRLVKLERAERRFDPTRTGRRGNKVLLYRVPA
jgi:hypothetical protein